jgi:hypothetical protein
MSILTSFGSQSFDVFEQWKHHVGFGHGPDFAWQEKGVPAGREEHAPKQAQWAETWQFWD